MVNVTPTPKNPDHPLDKIFVGIPAGSSDFAHASVRHYISKGKELKDAFLFGTGDVVIGILYQALKRQPRDDV